MKLDDHIGFSGERAVTAREFFRSWAQVEIEVIDKGQRDSPEIRRRWLKELVDFFDSEPTVTLPKELDLW